MNLTTILILLVLLAITSIGCHVVWDRRKQKLIEGSLVIDVVTLTLLHKYERNARFGLVFAFYLLGLVTPFALVKLFY